MSAAALTPRVRILVLCDEVIPSEIEADVFTLEGVRHYLACRAFPYEVPLSLFLSLSSPRSGIFQGSVRLVQEQGEKMVRYVKFSIEFDRDNTIVPVTVELGDCRFSAEGLYSIQIWFSTTDGPDVLKGELPFHLFAEGE